MTSPLTPLNPKDAAERLAAGRAILVDIREADEFARRRIPGAVSQPLSRLEQAHLKIEPGREVVFTCRSGMRTHSACDRLAARVDGPAYLLAGGLDAWASAGLPVEETRGAPLELTRQVQIAAGTLVLLGVVLGFVVHPALFGVSALVGAGLTFAGLTGFCGMARLLAVAPWNRPTRS